MWLCRLSVSIERSFYLRERKSVSLKIDIKQIIYFIIYAIAFLAILIPTNYDLNEWKFWSVLFGGVCLYCLGRYEGLHESREMEK